MFNRGTRNREGGLAILLLFAEMAHVGFDRIPPVTLLAIAGQAGLFLKFVTIKSRPGLESVCISALHVWYRDDWIRLILSAVYHADEWHLYYNMVSLLWKGQKLEKKLGSGYFLGLLGIFTVLVSMMLIVLSFLAEHTLQNSTYITQCHVGFSGVLFALKVLVNYMDPDTIQYLMGIVPVPSKIVCWAELVLIHYMVPNSSFIGHLAGILVGIWFVKGPFLQRIVDCILSPISGSRTYAQSTGTYYFNSGGASGHYSGGRRTEYNPDGETGYRGSTTGSHPNTNPSNNANAYDIRTRRLARLGQS